MLPSRADGVAPQGSRQGRKAARFVDSKYHAELEGLIDDFELELVGLSQNLLRLQKFFRNFEIVKNMSRYGRDNQTDFSI